MKGLSNSGKDIIRGCTSCTLIAGELEIEKSQILTFCLNILAVCGVAEAWLRATSVGLTPLVVRRTQFPSLFESTL